MNDEIVVVDSHRFMVGDRILIVPPRPRWYVRAWRWLTRWKPKENGAWVVTAISYDEGKITLDDRP